MRRLGARAGLWAPLLIRGESIGVLMALDRRQSDPRFSDADLRLAQRFAARAAVAVDLSKRVARATVQRILGGQEQERRRLSRELHDETGQALTSILLGLKSIEETQGTDRFDSALAELRELVTVTLQDVRRLAVELRPKALDDFGLTPALDRLTSTFAEQTGIETQRRVPASRGPPSERNRDRPLPGRPGGADEHRQARAGPARQHRAPDEAGYGHRRDRGRRTRVLDRTRKHRRPRAHRDA